MLEHTNDGLFSLGFVGTSAVFRCGRHIGLFVTTRRWSIRFLAGAASFIIVALLMIFSTFWTTFWRRLLYPKFRFHRWHLMSVNNYFQMHKRNNKILKLTLTQIQTHWSHLVIAKCERTVFVWLWPIVPGHQVEGPNTHPHWMNFKTNDKGIIINNTELYFNLLSII